MSALDNALKKLQKKYDDPGVIMDLRKKDSEVPNIERIDIDSPKIGDVFGKGGYPRGRIIEIFGPESGGKTSLATYLGGICQRTVFETKNEETGIVKKRNGIVLFIDAEHSLDPNFAIVHGFDLDKCILIQPDNGEQALDIIIKLVETGEIDMVIIDSIAALTPQAEIDADMDAQQMGLQARIISKFLRKSNSIFQRTKTTLVAINQIRDNLSKFGANYTTPGGKALKFYSSIRVEVKRVEWTLEGTETVGLVINMTCIKNKTAPPRHKQLVNMSFTKGFDAHLEWIDFAIDLGIIVRLSKVTYLNEAGEKIKSRAGITEYYSDPKNSEEYERVIKKTREIMNSKKSTRVSIDKPEDEEEIENEINELDELVKKGLESGESVTLDGEVIDKEVENILNTLVEEEENLEDVLKESNICKMKDLVVI